MEFDEKAEFDDVEEVLKEFGSYINKAGLAKLNILPLLSNLTYEHHLF